ncbi:MAG: HDOD domain-containing protein [Desulfobacterales bacterium]|nr:HDOD domain-containing protein [Desulfobacterales bacterium]
MTSIQVLISDIKALQPMPAVVHRVLEMTDQDDTDMGEIARVIQYDPSLTADILKTCNSAFFGLRQPAESISDAVTLLGMDQIVDLVLMKSAAKSMAGGHAGYDLMEGTLWKAAVASALISRQLAETINLPHRSTLFTAALLKDLGKTILNRFVHEHYQKINQLVTQEEMSFQEAEKQVIGVDHAELGAMIAKIWKFSPRMVKIIRHHHMDDPVRITDKDIAVVHLADCICMMMGIGVGADGLAYRFQNHAVTDLGISSEGISAVMADFSCRIQEVDDLLKVV